MLNREKLEKIVAGMPKLAARLGIYLLKKSRVYRRHNQYIGDGRLHNSHGTRSRRVEDRGYTKNYYR